MDEPRVTASKTVTVLPNITRPNTVKEDPTLSTPLTLTVLAKFAKSRELTSPLIHVRPKVDIVLPSRVNACNEHALPSAW